MHQEVVAMSFRVTRCGHGGDGVCWHGQVHAGSKGRTLAHLSFSTAGLPQAAGLGGPTNREEAQILLVPDFPTPQLLLRAALPLLSQGSLSSTPTLPGWQKRKESQAGSPYKGVGLGSYSVWTKGSPSA